MSEKSVLEVVRSITSNRESGRLEIHTAGNYGTLLFHEGKLVDARLGSLSGFQAVNAAVALRDVEFSFDHVEPALQVSSITPSERVVLQRFFGIEAAEVEAAKDEVEPDNVWNEAPEPVVPLVESKRIPGALFSKRGVAVAVFLALVIGLAVGTVAMRSAIRSRQQAVSVASAVKPQAVEPQAVQPEAVNEADVGARDLSGEWQVINTVEKTAHKSFNNLQVGFRLTVNQNGNAFTAKGEKFSENGRTLPADRRTPISVNGTIEGDNVVATFIEEGSMRRTNGRFVWKLQNGGHGLAGTFVSSAANSRGRSAVTKH